MAKKSKKSKATEDATPTATEASPIIKALEQMTDERFENQSPAGKDWMSLPVAELKAKGYAIGLDMAEKEKEQLGVVQVAGKPTFTVAIIEGGSIVFDPAEIGDQDYTVVGLYTISKSEPKAPEPPKPTEELES